MKVKNYSDMMMYLTRPDIMPEDSERVGFKTAGLVKQLLQKIPPGAGIKKQERGPEKKFAKSFLEYAQKEFDGNFKAAAESIGESREKIKGIFDRIRLAETGTRAGGAGIGKGSRVETTIPEPKKKTLYTDATTKVKADKTFLKDKIKNYDKNKFYTARDLGNILGFDFANNKGIYDSFTRDLNRFNVKKKTISGTEQQGIKKYQLGDVVNKLTKGYEKKLVKGQKVSQSERYKIDEKLDPDLKSFLGSFRQTTRGISKEEGIFVPGAIEDVGHPLSVKITDKYPKLTKNSNINKLNTLVYQDPVVNRGILEATGYEAKHDALFKRLNKIVNKKVGPEELQELQTIKKEMNNLYAKASTDIRNLSKEGTSLYNPRTKKTTTYRGSYFKGQEDRLPKIDINIPKEGGTFKSEDLFVNMSNVNPAFRVGLVDQINPNAKFFKDLTTEQKEIYKRNVLDQTKFNLDKFYTKAGFPKEQINELKDSLEFGTASKLGIGTTGVLGLGSVAAADEPGGMGAAQAAPLSAEEAVAAEGAPAPSSPLPTALGAGAGAAAIGTKTGRSLLGKAFRTLGTPIAGPAFAATNVAAKMGEGQSFADAVVDPLTGLELSFPGLFKESVSAITKNPTAQKILSLGRFGRMLTPVGLGLAGLGQAQEFYNQYQDLQKMKRDDPEAYQQFRSQRVGPALTEEDYKDIYSDVQGAAGGGIMKEGGIESGPQRVSMNPDSQGLASLLKRGSKS